MVEQRSALLLALLLIVSHAYTLVAYASRAIVIDAPPCADVTERFDAVGLECRPCPQGKVVSASGDQCECPAGTVLALADSSTPSQRVETCLSCDEWFTRFPALGNTTTLTPAYDGLQCISCGITASLAGFTNPTLSGGSCACPTGFATVEVGRAEIPVSEILALGSPSSPVPINAKMCVQCPADTVVDPLQPHVCSRCEYPKVRSASNACVCPAPLPTGAICADDTTTLSAISGGLNINLNGIESITYYNVPSVTTGVVRTEVTVTPAPLFEKYGVSSATACYLNSGAAQNNTACNALGNICVLNMYDPASAACTLFERLFLLRSERYHLETSPSLPWAVSMPWLTYEDAAEVTLKSKDLLTEVSLVAGGAGSSKVHELKLVLSTYAMSGEWLGFRNFTSQFQLCGGGQGEIDDWLRVGTNYINACEIGLDKIIERSSDYMESNGEPIFYDPYIVDALDRLYPIPVYVRNYRDASNLLVNDDDSFLNDVLVRRFFMTDIATTMGDSEHYMRYAASMKIVVNLRADAENRIFPPYIDIEYVDRQLPVAAAATSATSSAIASSVSTQVNILLSSITVSAQTSLNVVTNQFARFQMVYTSDLDKFRELWQILLILHLIFGSLLFSFRVAAYMRKRRNHALDGFVLVQVIVEGCFAFGVAFFVMCVEIATYWFCFFKLQQDVYTFLPGDNDFTEFQVLLTVGTIGISVSFAHAVFMQCCQDIFFIDWEKNKMTLTASGAKEYSPVSAWRTIFICNEYNELQGTRITNIELTTLLVVFLLEGTSLKYLSTITPAARDSESHFYSEQSKMLRFFIASMMLLSVAGVQYLISRGIVYRFVKHPLHQFLDLLSLSNHSVLILSSPYAGHYLHGRSTMPFTDVDMEHIIGQLRQESERSAGQPRGLVSTHDRRELADNQVFEIYVTPELRGKYDQLFLRHIQAHHSRRRHVSQDGLLGAVVRRIEHVDENIVKAHLELTSIFRNFINQVEQNPESYVREQYFVQKLLRLPPDMFAVNTPLFYHDLSLSGFASNVFLGIEFHHIILDTLIFCAIDSALENYVISGFIMYIIAKLFKVARNIFGEFNIAKKCLIDSRFLV